MTSNKLASARSIFEQNIQKNREAGCDRNILGQRTNCSRKVTRRLFAHTKLSDDSSSKGDDEQQQPQSRGRSSISSQASDASSVVAAIRRRSSQSSSRQQSPASSSSSQDDQQQAKGQTTTEQRHRPSSTELKPQEEEHQKIVFPPPRSKQEKISLPFQNFKQHQQQKDKRRGSISSLADHLSKLELQNLKNRPRGDADSIASQSSLETHRDQIRLPDFRQSSYVRSGVGACSGSRPRRSSRGQQVSSKSIQSSNGSHDSSNKPTYRRPMTDDSSNISRRTTGDRSPRTPPTANRRLSTSSRSSVHPSQCDNNNMSSPNSWIRPSAVVLEEDASEHQNRPFRSVPFTKSTIKRHRDGGKSTTLSPKTSRRGSVSMNDNSQSSLNSTDSTASRRMEHGDKSRRRSSIGACSARRRPPSKPDPQELALQEEMEALQKQIAASKAKLVQVQQGERYDLKRVEETKQRKLKRVDATERKCDKGNRIQLTPAEEKFLSDKYKSVKQTIRQFKQDNAKIHNDNRKQKLENWSIQADNRLLQESLTEVHLFVQERQAQHQQQLQEQDQLMHLAATYQRAILDTEEAIELKNPEKVKGDRMQLEDRIDILVDFMQKQCSDFALVEELTIMAFDDEEGWDDGSVDDDDDDDDGNAVDASSVIIQTPYHRTVHKNAVDSDDESPRSVTDLIIPTSSHSLHIFL